MQKNRVLYRIDIGGNYIKKKDSIRNDSSISAYYEEIGACRATRLIYEEADEEADCGNSGCEYFVSAGINHIDGYAGALNRGRRSG